MRRLTRREGEGIGLGMSEPPTADLDVRRVAALARIGLTDDEVSSLQEDLAEILAFVGQLDELDLEGLEPMYHPLPVENVMREDVPVAGPDPAELLRNAPATVQGLVRVPQMMEES